MKSNKVQNSQMAGLTMHTQWKWDSRTKIQNTGTKTIHYYFTIFQTFLYKIITIALSNEVYNYKIKDVDTRTVWTNSDT